MFWIDMISWILAIAYFILKMDQLISWLVGWADWLVSWFYDELIDQLINQLIYWQAGRFMINNQYIDRLEER